MLLTKIGLMIATSLLMVDPNGVTSCVNQGSRPAPSNRAGNATMPNSGAPGAPQNEKPDGKSEVVILGEGTHSEITNAFLVVARDPQVYSNLRKLAPGLPNLLDEFFNDQAVVAAFLGERNTGGYSVEITRAASGTIRVAAKSPPKDAMVTQVITTPFKVVSVPSRPSLTLDAEAPWQQTMTSYRISSGEFTMSGGFAGREERFALAGEILVMREGKFATLLFRVKSSRSEKPRSSEEAVTAFVENGHATIWRMGAGSLIEMPHGDLSAKGRFVDKKRQLVLDFTSLPTMIADGFAGRGSLEAEAAAPSQDKPAANNKPL